MIAKKHLDVVRDSLEAFLAPSAIASGLDIGAVLTCRSLADLDYKLALAVYGQRVLDPHAEYNLERGAPRFALPVRCLHEHPHAAHGPRRPP